MDCVIAPENCVGPTASEYTLPEESLTEVTVEELSFQPTTTTFKSPAICALENSTETEDAEGWGVA